MAISTAHMHAYCTHACMSAPHAHAHVYMHAGDPSVYDMSLLDSICMHMYTLQVHMHMCTHAHSGARPDGPLYDMSLLDSIYMHMYTLQVHMHMCTHAHSGARPDGPLYDMSLLDTRRVFDDDHKNAAVPKLLASLTYK